MTQPLYSVAQVEAMFAEAQRRFGPGGIPFPVLLGVLPLQSTRHAEFLHNEVPGITIPDAARAALKEAGEHGAEVGLSMALDLLAAVDDRVAGTYVMPSSVATSRRRSSSAASGPVTPPRGCSA